MRRPFLSVHTIAVSAIFIALGVILSFLRIPLTAVTELTFTGVPIAAGACLFGPAVGCVTGAPSMIRAILEDDQERRVTLFQHIKAQEA